MIIAMTLVIQAFVLNFTAEAATYNSDPVIQQDVSKMSNFEFISLDKKVLPLEPAGTTSSFADIAVDTYGDIYLSQSVPGDTVWGQAKLSKISDYGWTWELTHLLTDPGAFYPEHLLIDDRTNRIYMGNGINGLLQVYNKQTPSVSTKATKILQQYTTINGSKTMTNNYGMDIGPNGDLFLIQRESAWCARYGHRFETVNFTNTLEFGISSTGYPPPSYLVDVNDISVNRQGRAYIGDSYRIDSGMAGGDVEVFNGLAARNGAWEPIKRLDAGKSLAIVRKVAADGFGNVYAVDQNYWSHAYRINIISDNNDLLKRIDLPGEYNDYAGSLKSAILNPSGDLLVLNYKEPDKFQPFIETFALRQIIRPSETMTISINGYDRDNDTLEVYDNTNMNDPSAMVVNSITSRGGGNYDISVTASSSTGEKHVRIGMKDGNGGSAQRIIRFNVRSGMMNPPPPLPEGTCEITEYSIEAQTGSAVIDLGLESIAVEVAPETDLTDLVADFQLSPDTKAYVGDILQESGTTANDFTDPVTYAVTSEDGETTHYWTVYVTIATPPIVFLEAKVDEAEVLNEGDYTLETWGALVTALGAAQGVLDEGEPTTEQINTAKDNLNAAMDNLVRQVAVAGGMVNVPTGLDVEEAVLLGGIPEGALVGPVKIIGTLDKDVTATFILANPLPEGVSINQVSLYQWVYDRWVFVDSNVKEKLNGRITVSFTASEFPILAVLADTTAPANVTVTSLSRDASRVTLELFAIEDLSGIAGFYLYKDNLPVGNLIPVNVIAGDTTYTVTGLSAGTTYTFKARAEDRAGNMSDYSEELSVTTSSSGDDGGNTTPLPLDLTPTNPTTFTMGKTFVEKTSTTFDGKTVETFVVQTDVVNQLAKAKTSGKTKVEITVDSTATASTVVNIPADVAKGAVGMNVAIVTPNATLELPAALLEALATANQGLSLTVERGDADTASAQMRGVTGAEGANVLGTPTLINTAIVGNTTVTLPLAGIAFPDNPEERARFLDSLAVFAIHSDGEKKVITGTIVSDADGNPAGIKFAVEKFSTFAVIKVATKSKKVVTLTVGAVRATLDGKPYTLDAEPFINPKVNRTMAPVRFISEALGARVEWKDSTRQVMITDGGTEIVLTIDSGEVLVNGQPLTLECPMELMLPGRIFLPLRFVSESLGATVDWDANTQGITITR